MKCLSGRRPRKKPGRCLIGLGGPCADGLKRWPESRVHLLLPLLREAVGRRFCCSVFFQGFIFVADVKAAAGLMDERQETGDRTRRDETREEKSLPKLCFYLKYQGQVPVQSTQLYACLGTVGIGIGKAKARSGPSQHRPWAASVSVGFCPAFSAPRRGVPLRKEGLPIVSVRHGPSAT